MMGDRRRGITGENMCRVNFPAYHPLAVDVSQFSFYQ